MDVDFKLLQNSLYLGEDRFHLRSLGGSSRQFLYHLQPIGAASLSGIHEDELQLSHQTTFDAEIYKQETLIPPTYRTSTRGEIRAPLLGLDRPGVKHNLLKPYSCGMTSSFSTHY